MTLLIIFTTATSLVLLNFAASFLEEAEKDGIVRLP